MLFATSVNPAEILGALAILVVVAWMIVLGLDWFRRRRANAK